MREVEKLYAVLSPKFVLDHYFEILSLIGWRAQLEFDDEGKLNLSEIRDAILQNAKEQSAKIPWYSRVWLRAFDVAEEAVNWLIEAGLPHLEKHFGLPRIHDKMHVFEVDRYWFVDPQKVLDYNWEDCLKVWWLVNILKTEYQVTRSDFKSIRMSS